jgi:hypothetical protein
MSYIILRGYWCHIIVLNVHTPAEDEIDDKKESFYKLLVCVFDKFSKYRTKMLLDMSAKVSMEDFFKLTIGNKSLLENCNGNGDRLLNFCYI